MALREPDYLVASQLLVKLELLIVLTHSDWRLVPQVKRRKLQRKKSVTINLRPFGSLGNAGLSSLQNSLLSVVFLSLVRRLGDL